MLTKLNVDATKVVISGKASGALKGLARAASQEAMISGYGSISNTEVGVVLTHVYDGYETLRSFNAPALAKEAQHSAFAFFRDAIADAAENPIGELGTYHNVANGQDYNLFYEDLLNGHKMIEDDLLTSSPDSIEARLDYSNLDWNDPAARAEYLKNVQEYAQQTGLRDHTGFSESRLSASANELKILLHTSSTEEYTAYIKQFESAIQENFNTQLSAAQDYARELGYKGSLTDVKAMEKFAATLGPADKGAMEQLIQMTDGKINKVDQFILGRISDGQIDIQEVLAGTKGPDGVTRHMLDGVELDDKSLHALAALNVFAHSDAVASTYQTKILESIGGSTELCEFDLNNIKHVNIRCREFEDALTKAGYGAWQTADGKFQIATKAGKNGTIKGVGLQHMSMKQLRNIDLSKIKDPDVRNALKQYINLREHKDTLNAAKQLMQNMKMRITQLVRKVLGDSDLGQAIGQIQSQYRNVQFGMKMWAKIGDITKWIGKTMRDHALKKDTRILEKYGRESSQYKSRMQSNRSGEARKARYEAKQAKQKAKTKAKNTKKAQAKQAKVDKMKTTKKGRKKLAKQSKRAEKQLLKKAGKQGSDAVRRAGHLAKHGAAGTTSSAGTAAAGSSTAASAGGASAGAGSGAASAGATGGGVSAGVVCLWIILIALIVSAICQIIAGVCNAILSAATEFDNTLLGKMVNWVTDLLDNWKWPWEAGEEEKENVLWYTMLKLQNEDASKKQVANAIPAGSEFRGGMSPVKRGTADKGPHEYLSEDDNTYNVSWARPVYTSENIGNWPQADTYYVYTNAETGEPINEFTNIKTCLSMAHAYTYQIETKKHVENFTTYAMGLWNYLNKHEVTAILDMCNGCGTYTYDCNIDWECSKGCESPCKHAGDKKNSAHWESAYYGEVYLPNLIYKTSPGAKIKIYLNNAHKFYVVKGTPTGRTDRGCLQTIHNNTTGVVTTTDLLNLGRDSTTNSPVIKYSAYNSGYDTTDINNRKINNSYYGNSHGGPVEWYADPKAAKACFEKGVGNVVGFISFNDYNTTYCSSSTSPIYSCNNYEAKDTYKRIETTKYHQDAGSGPVHTQNGYVVSWRTTQPWCNSGMHTNERHYYQCKGHSTPVYCQETYTYTYTTSYSYGGTYYYPSGTYTVRATTSASLACSNSRKVENVYLCSGLVTSLPTRVTLYVCDGHTHHGTFDDTSKFWNECKNYVAPQYDSHGYLIRGGYYESGYDYLGCFYSCNGYKEVSYQKSSTKLYVCKGHFKCGTHYTCPDHTLTYCRGHISYQIERKSIWVESDAIYKDNWTYTVPGNKFLWFTADPITYSPQKNPSSSDHKSLARGDWSGWTTDNRELMATVYASDWYAKYGVGLDSFVGGQCSSTEKEKIKETFKITEAQIGTQLMQNLDFALDACGKVCYYPGDKAVAPKYEAANKFNTTAPKVWDKNRVQRGVHGLDPQYFADWVYRSTHNNATLSELTTSYYNNPHTVTSNVPAGTPIVNNTDANNLRSGILIGTFTQDGKLMIRYVGIDTGSVTGGGWVTILTESANGWRYSEKTKA